MEVVKDLTCPICLEFYSHPVILPCSHIMCKQPCADQLFEGNFIRCPVCRDNCYVSGGLTSLPRVITIESIIEKVRAERKKRNATSNGQARENSFDDVFSDVTSENRGSDRGNERIPVASSSSIVPICNSPHFPEFRSSPVSFSPRDLLDEAASVSNALLRSIPLRTASSTPDTLATSVSSQETTPINQSNEATSGEQFHLDRVISPPNTRHNTVDTSNSQLTHPIDIQFDQRLPIPQSVVRHSLSNGCHAPSITSTPSQATETYSLNRRIRQNTRSTHFSFQQPRLHSETETTASSTHQPVGNAGFSFSTTPSQIRANDIEMPTTGGNFTTDQVVQTSTPRSDLRNIRLCHEQSLANLKACSDSIRALQQSRPFFRSSHIDNSLNTNTPCQTDTANRLQNEGNETISFLGHITDILFDSSGSDESPRRNQPEPYSNNYASSPINPVNLYSCPLYNDINTPTQSTNRQAQHFDISQSICETDDIDARANVVEPMQSTARDTEPQNPTNKLKEDDDNSEVASVKLNIQNHLQKLCDIQNQLLYHMNSFTERAQIGEDQYDRGRSDINKECDSLVAEIENKRYHFLLHMDDERKKRRVETNDTTVAMEKLLVSSQELTLFVEEILESRPRNILCTASTLLDSLSSAVAECQACLQTSKENDEVAESHSNCTNHLVDTRLQRSLVQGLNYLTLPERPVFYVEKCTRNTSVVALVLKPPTFGNAIDHYEISYCSEEQKTLGIEERYYAKMPDDIEMYGGVNPEVFPIVLIENLCQSTHYFFCACAVNKKGKSQTSDYVQCKTLANRDCVVPVPSMTENRYQVGVTSATLTCPSLATVTSHQRVHHCLLQKTDNVASVWKGLELCCKREDFPVRKLCPETHYNFAVIAFNGRGECQVSNVLELLTHPLEPVNSDVF